jgi:hypothetical protein
MSTAGLLGKQAFAIQQLGINIIDGILPICHLAARVSVLYLKSA